MRTRDRVADTVGAAGFICNACRVGLASAPRGGRSFAVRYHRITTSISPAACGEVQGRREGFATGPGSPGLAWSSAGVEVGFVTRKAGFPRMDFRSAGVVFQAGYGMKCEGPARPNELSTPGLSTKRFIRRMPFSPSNTQSQQTDPSGRLTDPSGRLGVVAQACVSLAVSGGTGGAS